MAQKKLTKDRRNRDAAEYLLGLETLAEYFRITNFVSSLPSRAYKNEVFLVGGSANWFAFFRRKRP